MPPLADHSYLAGAMILVGLLLLVILGSEHRLRLLLLLSGLLAAPAGMLDMLFVPDYWQPVHLVSRDLSIEGVLFSFATGGLAVWCATRGRAASHSVTARPIIALRRYLLTGALALAVLSGALWAGASVMGAGLLAIIVTAAVCLVMRPDAWRLAAQGAIGFGALYLVVILGLTTLLPSMTAYWTGDVWGIWIAGVPLEEFAWAALYGALWPLVIVLVLGLQTKREPTRSLRLGSLVQRVPS
jgi:hypothetical protein